MENNQMPGGYLVGNSHANGGIKIKTPEGQIEAEGGEVIINKRVLSLEDKFVCEGSPKEITSKINEMEGGVSWSNTGSCRLVRKAEDGTEIEEDATIADDGFGLLYTKNNKTYIVTTDTKDQLEIVEMAINDFKDGYIDREELENTLQSNINDEVEFNRHIDMVSGRPFVYDEFYGGHIELMSAEPINIDYSSSILESELNETEKAALGSFIYGQNYKLDDSKAFRLEVKNKISEMQREYEDVRSDFKYGALTKDEYLALKKEIVDKYAVYTSAAERLNIIVNQGIFMGLKKDEENTTTPMEQAGSGSILRSSNPEKRPSPSISATIYPAGYRMEGNDGNIWEIALDSRGIHRWKRVKGEDGMGMTEMAEDGTQVKDDDNYGFEIIDTEYINNSDISKYYYRFYKGNDEICDVLIDVIFEPYTSPVSKYNWDYSSEKTYTTDYFDTTIIAEYYNIVDYLEARSDIRFSPSPEDISRLSSEIDAIFQEKLKNRTERNSVILTKEEKNKILAKYNLPLAADGKSISKCDCGCGIAKDGAEVSSCGCSHSKYSNGGGVGDKWRLPTIEEFRKILYPNKDKIPNLSSGFYWSSTEYGYFAARVFTFNSGIANLTSKDSTFYVRAVRDVSSNSNSSNSTIIGNLEIMNEDLGSMKWNEALASIEKLNNNLYDIKVDDEKKPIKKSIKKPIIKEPIIKEPKIYYIVELNDNENQSYEFDTKNEAFSFARKKEREGNDVTRVSKYVENFATRSYEQEADLLRAFNNYSIGLRMSSGKYSNGGGVGEYYGLKGRIDDRMMEDTGLVWNIYVKKPDGMDLVYIERTNQYGIKSWDCEFYSRKEAVDFAKKEGIILEEGYYDNGGGVGNENMEQMYKELYRMESEYTNLINRPENINRPKHLVDREKFKKIVDLRKHIAEIELDNENKYANGGGILSRVKAAEAERLAIREKELKKIEAIQPLIDEIYNKDKSAYILDPDQDTDVFIINFKSKDGNNYALLFRNIEMDTYITGTGPFNRKNLEQEDIEEKLSFDEVELYRLYKVDSTLDFMDSKNAEEIYSSNHLVAEIAFTPIFDKIAEEIIDSKGDYLRKMEAAKYKDYYAKGGGLKEISVYNLRKGDKVKTRDGKIETIIRKTGSGSYETEENDYSHSPESLEFISRPKRHYANHSANIDMAENGKELWFSPSGELKTEKKGTAKHYIEQHLAKRFGAESMELVGEDEKDYIYELNGNPMMIAAQTALLEEESGLDIETYGRKKRVHIPKDAINQTSTHLRYPLITPFKNGGGIDDKIKEIQKKYNYSENYLRKPFHHLFNKSYTRNGLPAPAKAETDIVVDTNNNFYSIITNPPGNAKKEDIEELKKLIGSKINDGILVDVLATIRGYYETPSYSTYKPIQYFYILNLDGKNISASVKQDSVVGYVIKKMIGSSAFMKNGGGVGTKNKYQVAKEYWDDLYSQMNSNQKSIYNKEYTRLAKYFGDDANSFSDRDVAEYIQGTINELVDSDYTLQAHSITIPFFKLGHKYIAYWNAYKQPEWWDGIEYKAGGNIVRVDREGENFDDMVNRISEEMADKYKDEDWGEDSDVKFKRWLDDKYPTIDFESLSKKQQEKYTNEYIDWVFENDQSLGRGIRFKAGGSVGRKRRLYAIMMGKYAQMDNPQYVEVSSKNMDEAMQKFIANGVDADPASIYFSNKPPYYYKDGGGLDSDLTTYTIRMWDTDMDKLNGVTPLEITDKSKGKALELANRFHYENDYGVVEVEDENGNRILTLNAYAADGKNISMNVTECQRCHQPTMNVTTMSMFNEDVICMSCKEKERKNPHYAKAVEADIEEIKKGNYNYRGIGYRPEDYSEHAIMMDGKIYTGDSYYEIVSKYGPYFFNKDESIRGYVNSAGEFFDEEIGNEMLAADGKPIQEADYLTNAMLSILELRNYMDAHNDQIIISGSKYNYYSHGQYNIRVTGGQGAVYNIVPYFPESTVDNLLNAKFYTLIRKDRSHNFAINKEGLVLDIAEDGMNII